MTSNRQHRESGFDLDSFVAAIVETKTIKPTLEQRRKDGNRQSPDNLLARPDILVVNGHLV